MSKAHLRDLQADAVELLKERGHWVIAGVETNIAWPKHIQAVPYGGLDFILRPLTEEDAATVCLNTDKAGITQKDARDFILRFGSALAWTEGNSFEVTTWIGASHPIRIGRRKGSIIQEFLDPELLPVIPDDDAATALAFFREGITIDNHAYAFLSLFKAVSFIHRESKRREKWFDKTLPTITDKYAVERLEELKKAGFNPGKYLWDEGRNAIAHAEKSVFVNPDKLVDHERIYKDLPIMRALARRAIEERFNLFSRLSREAHQKSPIPGFERIFGPDLIHVLLDGSDIEELTLDFPGDITALVRRRNKIITMFALNIAEIQRWENGCSLRLANQAGTMYLIVGIDFRNRKLLYEPIGRCGASLNKSSRASIRQLMQLHEMNWLYFGNGRLELWNTETDDLLGMTDEYIPLNMYQDAAGQEKLMGELQQLLDAAAEE